MPFSGVCRSAVSLLRAQALKLLYDPKLSKELGGAELSANRGLLMKGVRQCAVGAHCAFVPVPWHLAASRTGVVGELPFITYCLK